MAMADKHGFTLADIHANGAASGLMGAAYAHGADSTPAKVAPRIEPPRTFALRPLSGAARVQYRVRVVDRAADLPAADWGESPGGRAERLHGSTVSHDGRAGLRVAGRFRHAIVVDQHERPVAWTSLCTFPVDVLTLAGPRFRRSRAARAPSSRGSES